MAHLVFRRDPDILPTDKLSIYGRPRVGADTMRAYVARRNPGAPDVAEMYLRQAEPYGIRGDLAFCQAMLDTQAWTAEPQGPPWKPFAYAIWGGLASSDRSEEELSRRVERHLQKLSAVVDSHGTDEPCWEDLGGRWAVSDFRYGHDIVAIWRNMQQWSGGDQLSGKEKFLSGVAARLARGGEKKDDAAKLSDEGADKTAKLPSEESVRVETIRLSREASGNGETAQLTGEGMQGGVIMSPGEGRESGEAEDQAAAGSSGRLAAYSATGRPNGTSGMLQTADSDVQADRTASDHLSWLSIHAWVPTPPPYPGRKVSWGELARVIHSLEKQRDRRK